MENLLSKIHEYIDRVVEEFVKEHLDAKLKDIAQQHDVHISDLKSILEIDRNLYENTRCKANTILGKPCKYKSCVGESYCIKHKKLLG